MEVVLAVAVTLVVALAIGRLLGRRRRDRRRPPDELYGLFAAGLSQSDGLPHSDLPDVGSRADDEELELEESALDPDELEGDPYFLDEGADDELG